MPAKPIIIQKRVFIRGKEECPCCDHKFKYLLPVELLPWWDGLCSSCSAVAPTDIPKSGHIVVQIMEW